MKFVEDFLENAKEARKLIIKTMKERGISTITFMPDMEEWLKEDESRTEDDYEDLKYELRPCVTYFTKYGCGYEYYISEVSLMVSQSNNIFFKLEGDGNEVGYDYFYDYNISSTDMAFVYEAIGNQLGL